MNSKMREAHLAIQGAGGQPEALSDGPVAMQLRPMPHFWSLSQSSASGASMLALSSSAFLSRKVCCFDITWQAR